MASYSVFDAHNSHFFWIHGYLYSICRFKHFLFDESNIFSSNYKSLLCQLQCLYRPTDSFCFAHLLLRKNKLRNCNLCAKLSWARRKRSTYALRTHCSVTAVESNVVFISKKTGEIRVIYFYKIFWKSILDRNISRKKW